MSDAYKLTGEQKWRNRIVGNDEVPPDSLLANELNFRIHPKAQQNYLAGALDEVGWIDDVIVNLRRSEEWDDNDRGVATVIDGHLRVQLAMRNDEATVPVKYVDLTPNEERLALATFDPITAMAATDSEMLDELLQDVQTGDPDLQQMLSEIAEAEGLVFGENGHEEGDAPAEIDRAAELQEKWQVEPGQLWALGKHRLICGDATDAATVERVGITPNMPLFTDPPYGIEYDPAWLDDVYPHRQALSSRDTLQNDDGSLDLSFLAEHDRRMVWGFPYLYDPKATGWIVWDKQPGVEGRGIVTPIEMAYTTMRKGFDMVRVMWGGYYRDEGEDAQPISTQKPKGVYRPFIESWTDEGETVADYFCGSAPVMVVCEELGRRVLAVELLPAHCAVTIQRMVDAFGITPELVT